MDVPTEFVVNCKAQVQARVRARHTDIVNFQGQRRQVLFRGEDHEDDFKPLKVSLADRPHATAESHIDCRLARAISKFLFIEHRTISSAYAKIKKGKGKLRHSSSSIRIFQRKGERTLPCGQPSSVLAV